MKLIFPGGEHPQVLLGLGINRIGSDPEATIVLDRPGVQPQHCQLHVSANGVMLDVAAGTAVSVNGRPVQGLISLRSGDHVAFDKVQAHLASLEEGSLRKHSGANAEDFGAANDDPGATVIRPVLPKYLLRGITGSVAGRNFPLPGPMTVGRARESDLLLDEQGLSRHHARLVPTADGLQIEDLGSSNGSFINNQRVVRGEARAGDEIAFDTLRFRLVSSEPVEVRATQSRASNRPPSRAWLWLLLAVAAVVIALAVRGLPG
ncbi:MAG: FHA domain-containing protein [Pseudomonadota bacterium]|nr:FHA domain-containing protein [Pseudomonadota bacterium]